MWRSQSVVFTFIGCLTDLRLPLGPCMFWLNLIRPRLNIQLRCSSAKFGATLENSGLGIEALIYDKQQPNLRHNPQHNTCNHSSFDIQNFQRDGGFRNGVVLMMWLSLPGMGFIGIDAWNLIQTCVKQLIQPSGSIKCWHVEPDMSRCIY